MKLQVMYQAPGLATVLENKFIPSCMVHRRRIRKKYQTGCLHNLVELDFEITDVCRPWQTLLSTIDYIYYCGKLTKYAYAFGI